MEKVSNEGWKQSLKYTGFVDERYLFEVFSLFMDENHLARLVILSSLNWLTGATRERYGHLYNPVLKSETSVLALREGGGRIMEHFFHTDL